MYFYITTILTLSSMTPLRTDIHSKVEIEVVPTANSHTCRTFYPLYSYFPLKVIKETRPSIHKVTVYSDLEASVHSFNCSVQDFGQCPTQSSHYPSSWFHVKL